ncbi:hypothetical protein NE857_34105 (plasmid) [Nocardiopsis exhalans]|uniref:Uncharacterized protein n=1 Tax=Nocardiopsis exhalans TaxID=163604 RepID=A0ABY5DJ07_9ACTN|nr:hypothetical protein [Nocardiopsis exhalans]USY23568.1 hypothetical protein NE857_34105 [Nocardiopsis exhalans]
MARVQMTPAQLKRLLQEQLCSLTTPQAWERLVSDADHLGRYTARNRVLALAQYPEATSLAGSGTWSRYGRTIVGGQRGLGLLAVTRASGGGNTWGAPGSADVLAPDLRPPHEQQTPEPEEPQQEWERYRGETGATVVKVWDVGQTAKVTACAACARPAQVLCEAGCRGIPEAPTQPVPPAEWWRLVEELPEGFDPHPIWDALEQVVFLPH